MKFIATMCQLLVGLLSLVCSVFIIERPALAQLLPPPETILRVDGLDGSTTGDGSGWQEDAFLHLQDAIDLAIDPETVKPVAIWVRGGAGVPPYRPDQGANVTPNSRIATFHLANQVRLYGGFAGDEEETEFNDRDHRANVTVISGEINTSSLNDNSYHVVTAWGVGSELSNSAIIDGFTIRDGNAHGAPAPASGYPESVGGGMLIHSLDPYQAEPVVLRCTFENNYAVGGAAVCVTARLNSVPEFWHCTFKNNLASQLGGAVFCWSNSTELLEEELGFFGAPFFKNCLFHDNVVSDTNGKGGAIHCDLNARVTLRFCTLADNSADNYDCFSWTDTCNFGGDSVISHSIIWGDNDDLVTELSCVKISYSCIRGWPYEEPTNIDEYPEFMSPSTDNFRLNCDPPSPCINAALTSAVFVDDYDLDQGATSSFYAPDLDFAIRIQNLSPDMGAYEKTLPTCTGDFNGDGKVGTADLLQLINAWGPCPTPPLPCPWDLAPNGTVSTPDLLALINAWGTCPCRTVAPDSMPEEVTDCMEICAEDEDFGGCVQKCLCGIEYITEGCD